MIVVTGGAGFIGSNLVAGLEARGCHPIVVADRLRNGNKWRNLAKRELFAIVPPEELAAFLDRHADEVTAIFHMGAISATTETDVDRLAANNIGLTRFLWDWCAERRVRFIFASSAATYGDGSGGFDDQFGIEPLARLRPLNAYGWSKHVVDRFVARAVASGGPTPPQWAGLKFFNVYGPNEGHKGPQASVISGLYPRLVAGEPARLFRSHRPDYADGAQLRDFVWVGDCVAVMLWLLDTPMVSGLFNVGSGVARSFKDLALATFAAAGLEPRIEYIDMPEMLRDRYQYYTCAEIGRLRAAGFTAPMTSLEAGVTTYVRQFLANPDPYL